MNDIIKAGDIVVQVEEPDWATFDYPADEYPELEVTKVNGSFGGLTFKQSRVPGQACSASRFRLVHKAESDTTNTLPGMKFDSGKIMMGLMTRSLAKPLYAIAAVLTYGAMKYKPNNWQGVSPDQYESALDRHLTAWRVGEERDPDTNLHHLAHAGCNILFLLWFEIKDWTLKEIGTFNDPTEQYKEQREKACAETSR